jgi:hypothetical protein
MDNEELQTGGTPESGDYAETSIVPEHKLSLLEELRARQVRLTDQLATVNRAIDLVETGCVTEEEYRTVRKADRV